ncbi:MAG TPA: phage terminase small subunit P27 family [Candidatus Acidoferrum sp.]|jgi:P27 family predicted phage terminase small subunit|nr:phage terminase small subunit P27 family [Candidatus Acidoferrum sp.]
MAKGRRPLPTAVKKIRGNPGKRPLNAQEPTPPTDDPIMPADLENNPIAAQEWRDIVPLLRTMKVIAATDGKALAAYCHCYARWVEAEEAIREHGILMKEAVFGGEGDAQEIIAYKFRKNPAISISERALLIMKSYLVEFGLTPASRSKLRSGSVAGQGEQTEDPFESYLKQHPGVRHVN